MVVVVDVVRHKSFREVQIMSLLMIVVNLEEEVL